MVKFSNDNNVDIAGLVPVIPSQTFASIHSEFIHARVNSQPYLCGSCMMITKKVFDTIGYFDERLSRCSDVEYSQRALRHGFNIGYHPVYGVTHIGFGNNTKDSKTIEQEAIVSRQIMTDTPIEKFANSAWEPYCDKIRSASTKNTVLRM